MFGGLPLDICSLLGNTYTHNNLQSSSLLEDRSHRLWLFSMLFPMKHGTYILAAIQLLVSLTLATPKIGIRPDYLEATGLGPDKHIQSYSGIIKFEDGTIPLDKTRMTDAKLLNLCVLAYIEMKYIWAGRNLLSSALPGAMAAIAYKDKIYFASAIRVPHNHVEMAKVAQGTVRQYMDRALQLGHGRSSPAPTNHLHVAEGFRTVPTVHLLIPIQ